MLRNILKSLAIGALGNPLAASVKLRTLRRTESLVVLNLHRVGPDDKSTYPALSVDLFELLLKFITANFDVVTFGQIPMPTRTRPRLILSFDDGYADFFETAMPIMDKYGVRANLNIIPECVETGRPPLNVELQDLIGKAPISVLKRLDLPGLPLDFDQPRSVMGQRASAHIKTLTMAAQGELRSVVDAQVGDCLPAYASRMMTLVQVQAASLRHEIGGHSYSHANLGLEDDDYVRADIRSCRAYFETKLAQPMDIYAFPNGSYRPGHPELLAVEGVKTILLVDEGLSHVRAAVHPRLTFHAYSKREVIYRALGAYQWPIG